MTTLYSLLQTDEQKVWWGQCRQQLSFPDSDVSESQLGKGASLKHHFPFLWCDIFTQSIDYFLGVEEWVHLGI